MPPKKRKSRKPTGQFPNLAGRPPKHKDAMKVVSMRLPEKAIARMKAIAALTNQSDGAVVTKALMKQRVPAPDVFD